MTMYRNRCADIQCIPDMSAKTERKIKGLCGLLAWLVGNLRFCATLVLKRKSINFLLIRFIFWSKTVTNLEIYEYGE